MDENMKMMETSQTCDANDILCVKGQRYVANRSEKINAYVESYEDENKDVMGLYVSKVLTGNRQTPSTLPLEMRTWVTTNT